jgi:hypothetical protein
MVTTIVICEPTCLGAVVVLDSSGCIETIVKYFHTFAIAKYEEAALDRL